MPITPEAVLDALRQVEEPDLKKDLVTLNMVRDVQVDGQQVSFTVVLTTPACPLKDMIRNACITAVKTLVDANAEVAVNLTAEVTRPQGPNLNALGGVKNILLVGSGKGGVGKSTVAANLSVALAQSGASVGLLDADIYGPSVPTLFGLEGERPLMREDANGKSLIEPFTQHGVKVLSLGMLVPADQAVVWRGPMASNALRQLFTDTAWGELDYLVVDLPPGTGDIHITVAQQFPITGAVIVTTPQQVALADVRKAIAMLVAPQINVPVLGIVENMAYFETDELPGRRFHLFGEGGGTALAHELGLDLLAALPLVEAVRASGDAGEPIATQPDTLLGRAYAELGSRVAQQVAVRNAQGHASAALPR